MEWRLVACISNFEALKWYFIASNLICDTIFYIHDHTILKYRYVTDNENIAVLASEPCLIFVFKISLQCTFASCSCHIMHS